MVWKYLKNIICKKNYIIRFRTEDGAQGNNTSNANSLWKEDIIAGKIIYCENFDWDLDNPKNIFPIMYWLQRLHRVPTCGRFIVAWWFIN